DRNGFAAALAVGHQVEQAEARGEALAPDVAEKWRVLDDAVFAPLRATVGLDACEIAFSGAAPIPTEVIDFLPHNGVPMRRIGDRKKELIIPAGGKNVSPANIEAALKTIPLVGQAMAIGDAKPYLVAVLTLDPDAVRARFGDRALTDVAGDPDVQDEVARGV